MIDFHQLHMPGVNLQYQILFLCGFCDLIELMKHPVNCLAAHKIQEPKVWFLFTNYSVVTMVNETIQTSLFLCKSENQVTQSLTWIVDITTSSSKITICIRRHCTWQKITTITKNYERKVLTRMSQTNREKSPISAKYLDRQQCRPQPLHSQTCVKISRTFSKIISFVSTLQFIDSLTSAYSLAVRANSYNWSSLCFI